jgi:DNA-binding IscR family transcriptional regulator
MLELVEALEGLGEVKPRCVLSSGVCRATSPCPFHDTIAAARQAFAAALARDTLADVLARAGGAER